MHDSHATRQSLSPLDVQGCVYQFHQAPKRLRLGVEPNGNGGDPFHQTPNWVRAFDMDGRIHQNALESKPIEIPKVPSPYVWYLYFLFVVVRYIFEPLTEPLTLSFTQLEAAYPSVTVAARYCHEPLLDGNVCGTTQYGQAKSWLSLAAYLPVRPARLDIVITRLIVASVLWGVEPYDGIHRRKPCVRSRTANKSYCL